MCPGQHESAGKRTSGRRHAGNRAIRRVLAEAANAAAQTTKDEQTYLAARNRRLVVRIGKPKVAVAVGHTILRIIYHVLTANEPYREFTLISLDERRRTRVEHRTLEQLGALDYDVTITLPAAG